MNKAFYLKFHNSYLTVWLV